MIRVLAAVAVVLVTGAAPGAGVAGPDVGGPDAGRYSAPVAPLVVVHPFDPPATPYGAGHLGVDLAVGPGTAVRSAGAGVVRFAGPVAGRGVVVVLHPDGISTEYEPLRVAVSAGTLVRRGGLLGYVRGTHKGCRPGRCLHWGARRAGSYLDPLLLLRPLGPVRLLPWH